MAVGSGSTTPCASRCDTKLDARPSRVWRLATANRSKRRKKGASWLGWGQRRERAEAAFAGRCPRLAAAGVGSSCRLAGQAWPSSLAAALAEDAPVEESVARRHVSQ